jgi:hypothetical protein
MKVDNLLGNLAARGSPLRPDVYTNRFHRRELVICADRQHRALAIAM